MEARAGLAGVEEEVEATVTVTTRVPAMEEEDVAGWEAGEAGADLLSA